jgi:hypothetical protein
MLRTLQKFDRRALRAERELTWPKSPTARCHVPPTAALVSRLRNPFSRLCRSRGLRNRLQLDPSTATVADGHLAVFDDDGHVAAAVAEGQHALEIGGVLLDVDVVDGETALRVRRTGVAGVGSGVLAEDDDRWHLALLRSRLTAIIRQVPRRIIG